MLNLKKTVKNFHFYLQSNKTNTYNKYTLFSLIMITLLLLILNFKFCFFEQIYYTKFVNTIKKSF